MMVTTAIASGGRVPGLWRRYTRRTQVRRPGLSGVPAWSCGPADLAGDGRELVDLDGFELVEGVVQCCSASACPGADSVTFCQPASVRVARMERALPGPGWGDPAPRQLPSAVCGRSAAVAERSDEPREVAVQIDMGNFPAV
jgi:hypothetical protein